MFMASLIILEGDKSLSVCLMDPSSIKWDQNMLKRPDRNKDENKRHPRSSMMIEGGVFLN